MIDPEVLQELSAAGEDAGEISRVLEWSQPSESASLSELPTRRARLERLQALYADLKRPVLRRLGAEPGVVVDDLVSLPQAIVRASPARWRVLAAEGGFLDREPNVRVLPERRVHAVGSPAAD